MYVCQGGVGEIDETQQNVISVEAGQQGHGDCIILLTFR